MTLLILYRGRYQLFHIGDSRAYRIRSGVCAAVGQCRRKGHLFSGYAVRQLTKDDVVQGQLTRCMGAEQNEMPVYKTGRLHRKEGFLLCSDGFYGRLKDAEMAEALMPRWMSEESSIRRTLRELAKCARDTGRTG